MSDDVIYRQAAIDRFEPWLKVKGYNEGELNILKAVLYELKCLPSAESELEQKILAAGYTGKEIRIHIHGRLFAVRELAQ